MNFIYQLVMKMVTFLKIITMAMRIGNFLVVDYAHGDDTVDQNIHFFLFCPNGGPTHLSRTSIRYTHKTFEVFLVKVHKLLGALRPSCGVRWTRFLSCTLHLSLASSTPCASTVAHAGCGCVVFGASDPISPLKLLGLG